MNKIFLGKNIIGRKMFYKQDNDLIIEVATRLGFGTCITIPTLIENKENIIITDIKGEYYQLTKKYREHIGHKTLKINHSTTDEEIENILSENKFTIYIEINLENFYEEKILLSYTKFFKKLLGTIKEKNINCLTIVNEFPVIFSAHPYLLDYRCKNNKFLLRIQTIIQLNKINSKHNNIKIEEFNIAKMDFQDISFKGKKYKKIYYFKDSKYRNKLDLLEMRS